MESDDFADDAEEVQAVTNSAEIWSAIEGFVKREPTCHLRQRLQALGVDVSPSATRAEIVDLIFFQSDKASLVEGLKSHLANLGFDMEAINTDDQLAQLIRAQQNRRAKEERRRMQEEEARAQQASVRLEHEARQQHVARRHELRLADSLVKQAMRQEQRAAKVLVLEATPDRADSSELHTITKIRQNDMLSQLHQAAVTRKIRADAQTEKWKRSEAELLLKETLRWEAEIRAKRQRRSHASKSSLQGTNTRLRGQSTDEYASQERAREVANNHQDAYQQTLQVGKRHKSFEQRHCISATLPELTKNQKWSRRLKSSLPTAHSKVLTRSSSMLRLGLDTPDKWLHNYRALNTKCPHLYDSPEHNAAKVALKVAQEMHSSGSFYRLKLEDQFLPSLHVFGVATDMDMYQRGNNLDSVKQAHMDQQTALARTRSSAAWLESS